MTILNRGIKLEITHQLTDKAKTIIAQWIGCYGVIWTCKVAENQQHYNAYLEEKITNPHATRPLVNQAVAHFVTADREWLKEVPSQIRRNAGTKFREALNACFRGIRKAPRFRNKYSKKSCLVTNELFDVAVQTTTITIALKARNKALPFCELVIPKNEMLELPKILWLARHGARFWLSFSYQQEALLRTKQAIIQ